MRHKLLIALAALSLPGCGGSFPKDPDNTLEKVKAEGLVVGYSENPPWVVKTDTVPAGIEPALVKAFARSIGARVTWKNDTEHNLFEALEQKKIHLLVAGTRHSTPWKTKVALTRPYLERGKDKHVMAGIPGENAFLVALERFLHGKKEQLEDPLSHETDQ
ncbi:MAG: transporter substrate-binding domain-containing protein [Adhaeribacter sp.]